MKSPPPFKKLWHQAISLARCFLPGRIFAPQDLNPLYHQLVARSRKPFFYDDCRVADTVDGRFDILILHLFFIVERFEQEKAGPQALRALISCFVADMDANLREMGTGDLSVGRRIRKMLEAFKGRAKAYHDALEAGQSGMLPDMLEKVLWRNVHRASPSADIAPGSPALAKLASYTISQTEMMAQIPFETIIEGNADFDEGHSPERSNPPKEAGSGKS